MMKTAAALLLGGLGLFAGHGGVVEARKPAAMDPVSHDHKVEMHHSLHQPLDKSQVYWNFGGSTVLTKKRIRLTPDTQDRKGWLWNEYPLESENWEVEFEIQIWSKPHFGGDGMAMWVLSGELDPTFSYEPDHLNGPLFGMRDDFFGFGIVFDIYDNDNRRNNPSVYVLRNDEKKKVNFNHDNDYEDDQVKTLPEETGPNQYRSHRCIADVRNSGKNAKVLAKFLHKVLHVYVDTQEGTGWKFCLAVDMGRTYNDFHLAFSAATGQVADQHDIASVTTRYLADSDKEIDDSAMAHLDSSNSESGLFWMLVVLLGGALAGGTAFEMSSLRNIVTGHLDEVRGARTMNQFPMPTFYLACAVTAVLLLGGSWLSVFFNLPLLGFRAYEVFVSQSHMYTPASIQNAGHKGHAAATFGHMTKLTVYLVCYSILEVYYFVVFVGSA